MTGLFSGMELFTSSSREKTSTDSIRTFASRPVAMRCACSRVISGESTRYSIELKTCSSRESFLPMMSPMASHAVRATLSVTPGLKPTRISQV